MMKIWKFDNALDGGALVAAHRALLDAGYSYGSRQRGAPTAIKYGMSTVSNWRNLTSAQRVNINGVIDDAGRGGPVFVRLWAGPGLNADHDGKRVVKRHMAGAKD